MTVLLVIINLPKEHPEITVIFIASGNVGCHGNLTIHFCYHPVIIFTRPGLKNIGPTSISVPIYLNFHRMTVFVLTCVYQKSY